MSALFAVSRSRWLISFSYSKHWTHKVRFNYSPDITTDIKKRESEGRGRTSAREKVKKKKKRKNSINLCVWHLTCHNSKAKRKWREKKNVVRTEQREPAIQILNYYHSVLFAVVPSLSLTLLLLSSHANVSGIVFGQPKKLNFSFIWFVVHEASQRTHTHTPARMWRSCRWMCRRTSGRSINKHNLLWIYLRSPDFRWFCPFFNFV